MKCDLLRVNTRTSEPSSNPDEYPMRYIMKEARNFSSSIKRDVIIESDLCWKGP